MTSYDTLCVVPNHHRPTDLELLVPMTSYDTLCVVPNHHRPTDLELLVPMTSYDTLCVIANHRHRPTDLELLEHARLEVHDGAADRVARRRGRAVARGRDERDADLRRRLGLRGGDEHAEPVEMMWHIRISPLNRYKVTAICTTATSTPNRRANGACGRRSA